MHTGLRPQCEGSCMVESVRGGGCHVMQTDHELPPPPIDPRAVRLHARVATRGASCCVRQGRPGHAANISKFERAYPHIPPPHHNIILREYSMATNRDSVGVSREGNFGQCGTGGLGEASRNGGTTQIPCGLCDNDDGGDGGHSFAWWKFQPLRTSP